MEMPILIAISAAAGAVGGATITAVTNLLLGRQAARQRRREQLIERAYDAGMAEFRVHIEAHRANVERGHKDLPLAPAYFVSMHLVLLNELTDLRKSRQLDPDTITNALETASVMASRFEDDDEVVANRSPNKR
ncbi:MULTISPECIES: hypothetical protein [Burkholderia]|uniref:hypothetical protein n=1 Tax=Burkholderia TaxID=32008 RepID=UPI001040EA61|nr:MULTISPECIES: hypothetical protein [Burkholderia]